VLAERRWTKDAACADSDEPDLWFVEGSQEERESLTSPRALRAYLTCVGCPVRPQCLAEALMVTPVLMNPGDKMRREKNLFTYGTWGATSEKDRAAVRHLPTEEAIQQLEDGLPDRMKRRIAAFERKHNRGQVSTAAAWKMLDEMRGEPSENGEDAA
jgi:hypothetical protein